MIDLQPTDAALVTDPCTLTEETLMATTPATQNQPLVHFLESEGLYSRVEEGLRKAAIELSKGEDDFARRGLAALVNWRVQPSTAVSRFGSVHPESKTLRLTTLDCSREARVDTILHEVAHVLCEHLVDGRERHGPRWQLIARALGAQPNAAGRDDRFMRAAKTLRDRRLKTVARCRRCGLEIKRMRRSSRNWQHFIHRDCGGRFAAVP